MLDQREEVIVVGLLKAAADGEAEVDFLRSKICQDTEFEPYTAFKALQARPMASGLLTAKDISLWLSSQFYKSTLLRESDIQNILEHYADNGLMRYESFLKLILPREDKRVRSLVMCRRTTSGLGSSGYGADRDLGRDGGYHFVRLLEQEAALYEELTLRKKRLLEYEWREDKEHIVQRAFTWLQSESAVPGVCHVSVLGVCRLLCDAKEIMSVTQVERIFHRVNISGTDMLSYIEFERFLASREADAYLNELYCKFYTTMCPTCGAMCQREGGACNNVTCAVCRTTFKCETRSEDGELGGRFSPSYRQSSPRSPRASSPRGTMNRTSSPYTYSAAKKSNLFGDDLGSPINRSGMSTTASGIFSPRTNVSTVYSPRGSPSGASPRITSPRPSTSPRREMTMLGSRRYEDDSPLVSPSASRYDAALNEGRSSLTTYRRQKMSLQICMDTVFKMMEVDNAMQAEKEHLWQSGVNVEACFAFLDRYNKGYIADTDMWQIMHSDQPVSFSGICTMFRDVKNPQAKKQGQFSLAELTSFIFPRQSEEFQNVHDHMEDTETKSVLYVVRSTVSCPGCGARVQRTMEGCSSVTCGICHTPFRCNLIGDDRDQEFRLTLTQKHKIRQFIKFAVDCTDELERLRKNLMCEVDSLSTVLLDAFLLIAEDKGYVSFMDWKRAMLEERSVKLGDIEMMWDRFARDKKRLGFVEFAAGLRPFGSA